MQKCPISHCSETYHYAKPTSPAWERGAIYDCKSVPLWPRHKAAVYEIEFLLQTATPADFVVDSAFGRREHVSSHRDAELARNFFSTCTIKPDDLTAFPLEEAMKMKGRFGS